MSVVLIIEDDPYVLRFYERLFRGREYEVKLARDGEEGIRFAKEHKPNLILLDIMMPKMNGLDVLKQLVNDEETKGSSVVMLTNIDDYETMRKAIDLGALGFIVKTKASPQVLLAQVDAYLGSQTK